MSHVTEAGTFGSEGRQLEIPSGMVAISFSSGFFRQLSAVPFPHLSFASLPLLSFSFLLSSLSLLEESR